MPLFEDIIFGPITSRRLGISLGVNLLPQSSKLCNFDCIYCECGWNGDHRPSGQGGGFNSRSDVAQALEATLLRLASEGVNLDVITFAGNGEPTLHPHFEEIIDDTLALRDRLAPTALVAVLSNATMLHREGVRRALRRVDRNILKLDAPTTQLAKLINNPQGEYSIEQVTKQLQLFEGGLYIQTMFLRGSIEGERLDNTQSEMVEAWIEILRQVNPRGVMIYSIDRVPPCSTLEKVGRDELERIAEQLRVLSIEVSVA